MGMERKVRMLLAANKMTIKDLALKTGTTPQNLGNKLKRDNLNEKDLQKIAEACGARFVGKFVLDDGTEI